MITGVQQGSVLGPVLYFSYGNEIPQQFWRKLVTFADGTIVFPFGKNYLETKPKVHESNNKIVPTLRSKETNGHEPSCPP